jgi:hypothetical protein
MDPSKDYNLSEHDFSDEGNVIVDERQPRIAVGCGAVYDDSIENISDGVAAESVRFR